MPWPSMTACTRSLESGITRRFCIGRYCSPASWCHCCHPPLPELSASNGISLRARERFRNSPYANSFSKASTTPFHLIRVLLFSPVFLSRPSQNNQSQHQKGKTKVRLASFHFLFLSDDLVILQCNLVFEFWLEACLKNSKNCLVNIEISLWLWGTAALSGIPRLNCRSEFRL